MFLIKCIFKKSANALFALITIRIVSNTNEYATLLVVNIGIMKSIIFVLKSSVISDENHLTLV